MKNNVVQFEDIKELRETREKELSFYKDKLEELNKKLFFIEKEIKLTKLILDVLEKEKKDSNNYTKV